MIKDILKIKGKDIPVEIGDINQFELNFYPDNPRVFSIVHADTTSPTQEDIEKKLLKMDHVKQLIKDIKHNDGLLDPVIVHGGTMDVVEGNSRLAAYRELARKDPIKWGKIRAKILPKNVKESDILALLGQYHIIGKKDWQPYEIAGYLYRQIEHGKMTEEKLANQINLKKPQVTQHIKVYKFMIEHDASPTRWSYYDEYIKSKYIKKMRKEHPEVDKVIVSKIKSEEIPRAVDVRDGVKKIAEAGGKVARDFIEGKTDFDISVKRAVQGGKTDTTYKRLSTFRDWIHKAGVKNELLGYAEDDPIRLRCSYEIKKIASKINQLNDKL